MNKLKCIECGEPAVYVRSTQFSGDHPYCVECVKMEDDFDLNKSDSYQYWYVINGEDE